MFEQNGLEAMLACFGAFCFGMCWKRCCHVYVLEAMLAFFFCFGPTWEEALCMFDLHVLEAMLVCFRMFRVGQRGKRLCECVIKTF